VAVSAATAPGSAGRVRSAVGIIAIVDLPPLPSALARRPATIADHRSSCDEAGGIGCEKHSCTDQLARLAESAERRRTGDLLANIRGVLSRERGIDIARGGRRYPHGGGGRGGGP